MFHHNHRRLLLGVFALLGLAVFGSATPVYAQGGTLDANAEARRHLDIGRVYEEAGDLDRAIQEYVLATGATAPDLRQQAFAALQNAVNLKSDPWYRFRQQIREVLGWTLSGVVVVLAILTLVMVFFLLLRRTQSQAVLTIMPFSNLTGQENNLGALVAEVVSETLIQARIIHASNQQNALLSVSEEIDMPSFSSQSHESSLVQVLSGLTQINVGGINLPVGSVTQPFVKWLRSRQPRIVGTIQQEDQTLQLTARLERGRGLGSQRLWQVSDQLADDPGEKVVALARTLSYQIILGLSKGGSTADGRSLEHFTLGLQALQAESAASDPQANLRQAAQHFEKAFIYDPGYAGAKYNLAITQIGLGNCKGGIELLKSLQLPGKRNLEAEIWYNLGIAYYQLAQDWAYEFGEKALTKAIQVLNTAGQAGQDHRYHQQLLALSYAGLASICAQRVQRDAKRSDEHLQSALEHVKKALELGSQDVEIRAAAETARALAYLNKKYYDQAVQALEQVIELKPDYWRAYIYLGQAQMDRERLDEAVQVLQYATTLNPTFEYAQYQLGRALKQRSKEGDLENAYAAFGKVTRIASARDELGRLYASAKEYDKALTEFRQALSINSQFSDAASNVAWYLVEAGKRDAASLKEALECAQHSVNLERGKRSEGRMRSVLGRVYLELGKPADAEKELRASIALDPERAQSHYFLARALFEARGFQEARDTLIHFFRLPNKSIWEAPAKELMAELRKVSSGPSRDPSTNAQKKN